MTDRHQQKPYPLRMSDDLRSKVEEASVAYGRSMNAEIIARLTESFDGPRKDVFVALQRDTDVMLTTLTAQVQMLQMRIDLARVRLDGLFMKRRALEAESRQIIDRATTESELTRAEAVAAEVLQVLSEAREVEAELSILAAERDDTIAKLDRMREMISAARTELQSTMDVFRRVKTVESETEETKDLHRSTTKILGRRS